MLFKASEKTVETVLSSKKPFVIPKFQREYSWNKNREVKEFLMDIISNIDISDLSNLKTNVYFFGTMLLIGDIDNPDVHELIVVDGQQRLTTISILLSAIMRRLNNLDPLLSKQIHKLLVDEDRDGRMFNVLFNDNINYFFGKYVQDITIDNAIKPKNEEEERIKAAYDYYYETLDEKKIKKLLQEKWSVDILSINTLEYKEILKAVRNQLLNSYIIMISCPNSKMANTIFEILNAKGLELSTIDLIKNKIFEVVKKDVPYDEAKQLWKNTQLNLLKNDVKLTLSTYFRHYWNSKYSNPVDDKLYDEFKSKIVPKNEQTYIDFLREFEKESVWYNHLVNPTINFELYQNQERYQSVIESLKAISSIFNIVQARPLLLSLHYARFKNQTIKDSVFIEIINELDNFHFAYNYIASKRPSSISKLYYNFAHLLRHELEPNKIRNAIRDFLNNLRDLYPSYEVFSKNFIEIDYSNKHEVKNSKIARYVLNKYENKISNRSINRNNQTIEHIIPESHGAEYIKIGNLMLLEKDKNERLKDKEYTNKTNVYSQSEYEMARELVRDYPNVFNTNSMKLRAEAICKYYYTQILGLEIN